MLNIEASKLVYQTLKQQFDEDRVKLDNYEPSGSVIDFPVLQTDLRIVSSTGVSDLLGRIPPVAIGFVFVEPSIRSAAQSYIRENLKSILNSSQ